MINLIFFFTLLLKRNLSIAVFFCIIINHNSSVIAKTDFFPIALVQFCAFFFLFYEMSKKNFYKKHTIYNNIRTCLWMLFSKKMIDMVIREKTQKT